MAYWLIPGTVYHTACGSHTDFRRAKNETVRSSDKLIKRVTIGRKGWPNVISYDVTFVTAEDHQSATFEALTGYMTPEFSDFLAYDLETHAVVPLADGPGEQALPVILATPDHSYAMGIFSAGLPQPTHSKIGYGRFRFRDTVKWNAVYRVALAPRGEYSYHCDVLVGSVEDVRGALEHLTQSGKVPD
jgi:hypothetical protein